MMEGFTHLGSMIVIGEKLTAAFLDELSDLLEDIQQIVKLGFPNLSVPGFTIRVLASTTQAIEKIFMKCHQLIREQWFDKKAVFLRKY